MGVLTRELSALYAAYHAGEDVSAAAAADPVCGLCGVAAEQLAGDVLEQQAPTGSGRWPGRRRCWSCRRIVRARCSRIIAGAQSGDRVGCGVDRAAQGVKPASRHDAVHDVLAAWGVLLSRLSGQDDVVIGCRWPIGRRRRSKA